MKKQSSNSLSLKLKLFRYDTGLSQEEFSSRLGIPRGTLANYETGKRLPDKKLLARIASEFHVMDDVLMDQIIYQHPVFNEDLPPRSLKELVQNHGAKLDISQLSPTQKLSMLTYYDYILKIQKEQNEATS